MKAVLHKKYGPPSVLEIDNIQRPIPKDNEVLVRVYAATVNRTDCAILRAKPFIMRFVVGFFRPNNPITGTDFAGEVEAIGNAVTNFRVGDKVFGFGDEGLNSHAEYITIAADQAILTMPKNMNYKEAVACCEGAHYAYTSIKSLDIKKGQKVLVNGATGAIGSAALQLSKHLGADVVAVAQGKDIDLVKSLGAERVIDYTKEDFTKENKKYDYIFDSVGKSSFPKCKSLLKDGGIYNSSELGWMAQNLFFVLSTKFFGKKKVIFPIPKDIKTSLEYIKGLIEKGKFKAVIDRTYPIEKIQDAYNYVETGQKIGNVIITI